MGFAQDGRAEFWWVELRILDFALNRLGIVQTAKNFAYVHLIVFGAMTCLLLAGMAHRLNAQDSNQAQGEALSCLSVLSEPPLAELSGVDVTKISWDILGGPLLGTSCSTEILADYFHARGWKTTQELVFDPPRLRQRASKSANTLIRFSLPRKFPWNWLLNRNRAGALVYLMDEELIEIKASFEK